MGDPRFGAVDPVSLRAAGSRKWNRFEPDVLAAWIADMDFPLAGPITDAIANVVSQGFHGYPLERDVDELLELFCAWQRSRFGLRFDPTLIVTSSDVVQAIQATVFAHSAPGDRVLILTPLYPPFAAAIRTHARSIVEHRMAPDDAGEWQVDRDRLRAQIAEARPTLFLLCSPHNPVGRLWTREELEFFASLAIEFDMLVVADEIHAELVFCDRPMIGFSGLSDEVRARTITITSANKTFNLAGLKVAFIAFGSVELRAAFHAALPGAVMGALPTIGVHATIAAYRSCALWLNDCLGYLRGNIDVFADSMAERVPLVRVVRPEATYLSWLDFSAVPGFGRPVEQVAGRSVGRSVGVALAAEARVGLNEGETFGDGLESFARINLATSRSIVLDAVDRIGTWVDAQSDVAT